MQPSKMLHDRQAKPGAADIARPSPVGAVKSLKYAVKVFRKNAFAGVCDRDPATSAGGLDADRNASAFAVELDRIVNEICEHLLETDRIAIDPGLSRDLIYELDLPFGGLCRKVTSYFSGTRPQLDLTRLYGNIA